MGPCEGFPMQLCGQILARYKVYISTGKCICQTLTFRQIITLLIVQDNFKSENGNKLDYNEHSNYDEQYRENFDYDEQFSENEHGTHQGYL